MATEVVLQRARAGDLIFLRPLDGADAQALEGLPSSGPFRATLTQPRNILFHRKFFALLNLGFEHWSPRVKTYKGMAVQKNFEVFREQVTIAAGHYEIVPTLGGGVRMQAKSISFAKCSEEEFAAVYYGVMDVLIEQVLKRFGGRDDIDAMVGEILRFGDRGP